MKVVLMGAGNVGHHLGCRLYEVGINIVQVYSRKIERAKVLSKKLKSIPVSSFNAISHEADLYILAIHDDAIKEVSKQMFQNGFADKLIVHTSGATPQSIFKENGLSRFGVFYPLQTFSMDNNPDFEEIPICIDASLADDLELLNNLAKSVSPKVYHISDEKRVVVHVAAVFVNNFTNYLFRVAEDILEEADVPLEILLPLIQETVNKLEKGSPAAMQTGPAIRGDKVTIQRHLTYLKNNPDYKEIYSILTEGIINNSKKGT